MYVSGAPYTTPAETPHSHLSCRPPLPNGRTTSRTFYIRIGCCIMYCITVFRAKTISFPTGLAWLQSKHNLDCICIRAGLRWLNECSKQIGVAIHSAACSKNVSPDVSKFCMKSCPINKNQLGLSRCPKPQLTCFSISVFCVFSICS